MDFIYRIISPDVIQFVCYLQIINCKVKTQKVMSIKDLDVWRSEFYCHQNIKHIFQTGFWISSAINSIHFQTF